MAAGLTFSSNPRRSPRSSMTPCRIAAGNSSRIISFSRFEHRRSDRFQSAGKAASTPAPQVTRRRQRGLSDAGFRASRRMACFR